MRAPSSSKKGEERSETRLQDPDNLFFSVVHIWSDTFAQVHRGEGTAAVHVRHCVELKRTEALFGGFLSSLCCKEFCQSDHEALNVKQTFSAQASLLHFELKTLFWINEQHEHLFTVGEGLE